jgi:hypothetical protein
VILLGGRSNGTRLNTPYKDLVRREHLVRELVPLLAHFKEQRRAGESFGDFCERAGVEHLRAVAAAALGEEDAARRPLADGRHVHGPHAHGEEGIVRHDLEHRLAHGQDGGNGAGDGIRNEAAHERL